MKPLPMANEAVMTQDAMDRIGRDEVRERLRLEEAERQKAFRFMEWVQVRLEDALPVLDSLEQLAAVRGPMMGGVPILRERVYVLARKLQRAIRAAIEAHAAPPEKVKLRRKAMRYFANLEAEGKNLFSDLVDDEPDQP